jgi:hypothetical protein
VPIEPEVAAQLHPRFTGRSVALLGGDEKRVERCLEVGFLADTALEGPDLIGALDAVADLAAELRVPAGVP